MKRTKKPTLSKSVEPRAVKKVPKVSRGWAIYCKCHGDIERDDSGNHEIYRDKPPRPINDAMFHCVPVRIVPTKSKSKRTA